MLKEKVSFRLGERQRVLQIQRTYKNTWTLLVEVLKQSIYVKHLTEDGTEIKVYKVSVSDHFELVSESKILVPYICSNIFIVIDLLKGSSESFTIPNLKNNFLESLKSFRFCQSGLLCLHLSKIAHSQCPCSDTFWYYNQSSLEEGKPLLTFDNTFKCSLTNQSPRGRKANQHSLIISYSTRPGNK